MTTIVWLGLIVVLAAVGVLGDFFIKIAGTKTPADLKIFFLGLIIYASTAFGWLFVMRHVKLSTLGVFYALGTILFLTIISVFYFKESLYQQELIGIIFAVAAIILLGRFA